MSRVIMIYDTEEFPIAQFTFAYNAARYLGITKESLLCALCRNRRKIGGKKVMYVDIED